MKRLNFILGTLALAPLFAFGDEPVPTPAYWSGESDHTDIVVSMSIDCRRVFTVADPEEEFVLQGLMYSALGWVRDVAADPTRTVTVTAQSGKLLGAVFTPDDNEPVTILPATEGEGTFEWHVTGLTTDRTFLLTHTVKRGSVVDASATLYGYFCFYRDVETPIQQVVAEGVAPKVRLDLREGVRTPKRLAQVLPFQYSSTNWVGDVIGVSPTSVAKVAIVQLTGDDPDVAKWTTEVPGTAKVLKQGIGDGEVPWNAKKGVWRATFEILNGDKSIHEETAIFDLRNSTGNGLVIMLAMQTSGSEL